MALALLVPVSWAQCGTQVSREREKVFAESRPLSPAGRRLGPAPDPTRPWGQRPPGYGVHARPGLEATLGATSAVPRRQAVSLHTGRLPRAGPASTPLTPLAYLRPPSTCLFGFSVAQKLSKTQTEGENEPFTLPHGQTPRSA